MRKIFDFANVLQNVDILSANGYSSALSKAKTILSINDSKVMLILDTDSVYENEINEKKGFVNSYIGYYKHKRKCKIIWFSPELEIMFLRNRKFMSILSNNSFTDSDLKIGSIYPKKTLELISEKNRNYYIKILDDEIIMKDLLKDKSVKEMLQFIKL